MVSRVESELESTVSLSGNAGAKSNGGGVFACKACDQALFSSGKQASSAQYTFSKPISKTAVYEQEDFSFGMQRMGVHCSKCDAIVGNVYNDGGKKARYVLTGAVVTARAGSGADAAAAAAAKSSASNASSSAAASTPVKRSDKNVAAAASAGTSDGATTATGGGGGGGGGGGASDEDGKFESSLFQTLMFAVTVAIPLIAVAVKEFKRS